MTMAQSNSTCSKDHIFDSKSSGERVTHFLSSRFTDLLNMSIHNHELTVNTRVNEKSTCVGTGFVALDVIVNGNPHTPAKLCAGGSCGNVLSILSFLGWNSSPIARLGNNEAAKALCDDLVNFNVDTSLISITDDGSTPVIIHRILKDQHGNPKHKFEFRDPATGAWLPGYKPVLKISVDSIVESQPSANVFFFDRVSRSSIDLAKYYKAKGALIYFEPSSMKRDRNFDEALELADITKFSNERLPEYETLFPDCMSDIEIQTLGKDGIKYRLKSSGGQLWTHSAPYILENTVDTAGAGDWCTAGIISKLQEKKNDRSFSTTDVESAIDFGQALGALNCLFFGARGMMYSLEAEKIQNEAFMLISKSKVSISPEQKLSGHSKMKSIQDFAFEMIL